MNAEWTGPLLRDVLTSAGLIEQEDEKEYEGLHVQMECNATKVQDDEWYGSSVPLAVAMDREREVILALEVRRLLLLCSSALLVSFLLPRLPRLDLMVLRLGGIRQQRADGARRRR